MEITNKIICKVTDENFFYLKEGFLYFGDMCIGYLPDADLDLLNGKKLKA